MRDLSRLWEIAPRLCIAHEEADDNHLRCPHKFLRHLREHLPMKFDRIVLVDQNRIIAPADGVHADNYRELTKCAGNFLPRWHMWLDIPAVGRDRDVPELTVGCEEIHMRQHRRRILRAKGNEIDDGGIEAVARHLRRVIGIAYADLALAQTIYEPWRIKCRDVCTHTRMQYHRHSPSLTE